MPVLLDGWNVVLTPPTNTSLSHFHFGELDAGWAAFLRLSVFSSRQRPGPSYTIHPNETLSLMVVSIITLYLFF